MGRYSCAIGGCDEKTYDRSTGIKFFHIKHFSGDQKNRITDKILATRMDLNVNKIKDVVVCSRHFPEGDKTKYPLIIPRKVNGIIVWPNETIPRRKIVRTSPFPSATSTVTTTTSTPLTSKHTTGEKLDTLMASCNESPEKVVSLL